MMASFAKASDYYFHSFGISANWVNSQFIEHASFFPPSLGIEQELYICHPHQCKMVIYAVIWGLIQNDAVSSCPRWFLTVSRHKIYIEKLDMFGRSLVSSHQIPFSWIPWILVSFIPLLLQNYSSILTLHPDIIDGRPGTLVIESFVVDVPDGNTKDETCYFVEALIKCNLKSLSDVSERLAVQGRTEPINRYWLTGGGRALEWAFWSQLKKILEAFGCLFGFGARMVATFSMFWSPSLHWSIFSFH